MDNERTSRTWHHLWAILLLPGIVTVVIPATILAFTGLDAFGVWHSSPANIAVPVLGIAFIGLGLMLMVATIRLFVTVGRGTLAPWNPPQHFVVRGIYRHVRNPMISGVFSILLGESLLAASLPVFAAADRVVDHGILLCSRNLDMVQRDVLDHSNFPAMILRRPPHHLRVAWLNPLPHRGASS